jgi:hypothetical protein
MKGFTMLFHISGTHSYDTCNAHNPDKLAVQTAAFATAEEYGVKIHFHVVNRLEHNIFLLVEADSMEFAQFEITPVIKR